MRHATLIFALGCMLGACGSEEDTTNPGAGTDATGGPTAPQSGQTPTTGPGAAPTPTTPSTATPASGTAGMMPGMTPGITPGMMPGMTPGAMDTTGAVDPMGMTTAGTPTPTAPSAVGMDGMTPVDGAPAGDPCAGTDMGLGPADLHAAAADVLTMAATCGSSSCHGGSRPRAGLELLDLPDLNAALVGKPACEAPNMPLIDGSGGANALSGSYLWFKITGEGTREMLVGDPATFGTAGACGQAGDQPYGALMPLGTTEPMSEARLGPIRAWICAGAPGPN